jgi:D-methionine transport system substrate-binding protein
MFKLRSLIKILVVCAALFSLAACQKQANEGHSIKVGTISGPETELMEEAKKIAQEKYHLNIIIVPFSDYTMPNEALADKSIGANMFQTQSYLDEATKAHGYHFVVAGKTFVYPMGLYSKKIKNLSQLKEGAVVAIANDPSNHARGLLLLEKAGLITLKAGAGTNATVADITSNPKKLKFKELDAAQIPRVLPDVDLAAINTNYAMVANIIPSRDALFRENADSPYANLVVVVQGKENDPRVQELMKALNSEEVEKKAQELFKGQAVPAWK